MTTDQSTERTGYIQGLRELADFLEAHDGVPVPFHGSLQTGKWEKVFNIFLIHEGDNRERIAMVARAMGNFEKRADGSDFRVFRRFGGITLVAQAAREDVCERVVVGTREVTVTEPDPAAVAALPTVTTTKVVEDVEWICSPLLAGASDATE